MSTAMGLGFGLRAIRFFGEVKVAVNNLRSNRLEDEGSKPTQHEKLFNNYISEKESCVFDLYGLKEPGKISRSR